MAPVVPAASFGDAREVTLRRNPQFNNSFGVVASGDIMANAMPTITTVHALVIEEDGQEVAEAGEMLLKVDGTVVVGLLHDQVAELFEATTADTITLLLFHAKDVPKSSDVLKLAAHDPNELTQALALAIRKAVQSYTTPITTRAMREGEVDGREYHFVSIKQFEQMVTDEAFFEYSTHPHTGVYYGSPLPKQEDVQEAKHINRHKSLKVAYRARANEATVGNVLAGHDPSGTHSETIASHVASEEMSVSEFLMSVPEDDPTLAEARQHVKLSYYNLTCPYTTREPREGEKDGRDYNFVSLAEFKALLEQGKMLEYGVHANNMYGTAKLDRDDGRPDSPQRTQQPSRTEMLMAAAAKRKDDATVGDLLRLSAKLSDEHGIVADKTVSEFLMSTGPDDPVFGGVRKQVKTWVYDCMIPYTTRPRRETEIEGREYHFVSDKRFQEMMDNDEFLEYGAAGAYDYGTPRVKEKHVHHTAEKPRKSRAKSMQQAMTNREKHIKVGHLLENATDHTAHKALEHNGKAISDHTVSELLGAVDPDHPKLGETRLEIKKAIWSMMVPYTTRSPREGELEGREYHFVSREEFFDMLSQDMFVEHGARNGHFYGTLVPSNDDVEAHKAQKSGGHLRMSLAAALVGSDELPELTIGHFHELVDGGALGVDHTMPVSKFFHHVEEDHPEFGELRQKIKARILDMTVPYTTRAPRMGEIDGVDYTFVTVEAFERMIGEQLFFEFGTVSGDYYGTPRVTVQDLHPEDRTRTRVSRASALKTRIAAAQEGGEITVGHFIDNHNSVAAHPEIANHRDVPLSVFFARASHGHEAHAGTISSIRDAVHNMSTPFTTRPRREGEKNGRDYMFVSEDEFEERKNRGDFLEFGTANGHNYATPKLTAEDAAAPRSRKAEFADHYQTHTSHATVKDTLEPELLAEVDPAMQDKSLAYFLSKTSVHDERYTAVRARIKAAVYASSVPWTTRPPREGEEQDDHYHFCSKEEFDAAVDEDKFLEWGENNGNYYGTVHPEKDHVDQSGGLKKRAPRASAAVAIASSQPRMEELKYQLDAEVLEKMQLQRRLETIKGYLTDADGDLDSEQLLAKIHAAAHDESTPLPSLPFGSPDGVPGAAVETAEGDGADPETVALREQFEAQKVELHTSKAKLQAAADEKTTIQKDLDQHKADLDLMRESMKSLNHALALQQAAPGITPEQLKALVADSGANGASRSSSVSATTARSSSSPAAAAGTSPPSAWGGDGMTSLKAKMLARRWGNKSAASVAEGEDGEDMSPLKKKLMERRKAKMLLKDSTGPDSSA